MPNGTCVKLFESSSRVFRNLTSKPRGNTQALLVPAAFSGEARDFYLGVVHAESQRAYLNYFYKMQVGMCARVCTAVYLSAGMCFFLCSKPLYADTFVTLAMLLCKTGSRHQNRCIL